jgi:hypothetical protein
MDGLMVSSDIMTYRKIAFFLRLNDDEHPRQWQQCDVATSVGGGSTV